MFENTGTRMSEARDCSVKGKAKETQNGFSYSTCGPSNAGTSSDGTHSKRFITFTLMSWNPFDFDLKLNSKLSNAIQSAFPDSIETRSDYRTCSLILDLH